jgi:hypothetical protein
MYDFLKDSDLKEEMHADFRSIILDYLVGVDQAEAAKYFENWQKSYRFHVEL